MYATASWVGMLSVFSFRNAAARCLEETTVYDQGLHSRCTLSYDRRGERHIRWAVVSPHVHHDERTNMVNRTEIDVGFCRLACELG